MVLVHARQTTPAVHVSAAWIPESACRRVSYAAVMGTVSVADANVMLAGLVVIAAAVLTAGHFVRSTGEIPA